jgi:crotonobetaine/carnitine-CoA ligase
MTYVVPDRREWTLPSLLLRRGEELGHAPFLSFALGERELSYGETAHLAEAVAGGLAGLGVGRGDRVLLMMRNRAEFVLAWLGATALGGVQVPVNVDYRGGFLEHLVDTSGGEVLVVETELLDAVAASLDRMPRLRTVIVVGEPAPLGPRVRMVPFGELLATGSHTLPRVLPSDTAAIHFTSGTSGRSKGALVPHAHAHLLAERNRELLGLERGDVYLTELPLFHINAQMSVQSALLVGAQVRIERRFSASAWLNRVRESGASHTSLLGVMLGFLLAQPESRDDADNPLRVAWTVPCPEGPATAFRERFGLERVVTSYGSTEIGMVARRVLGEGPAESAGRLEPDVYEVSIVDDYDEPLAPGEVGELLVRPTLPWTTTQGYVGMPEATAAAFRNLWFHTGDLARLDGDGNLWFLDRFSDRIRRRGENVASADVELVLEQHPAIGEAAVVAVPAGEGAGAEDEIKAVIVPAAGASLDAETVWAWCDERLPHFAVPRYVELVPHLPKTPTAKVRKSDLRAAGVGTGTFDRGQAAARQGRR